MIQRKQTLWLGLIFFICMSSVGLNIPFRHILGQIDGKQQEDAFVSVGFSSTETEIEGKEALKAQPNTLLKYCTLVLGITSLLSIFLFKRRQNQLMLGKVIYLLALSMAGLMFYYGWSIAYIDYGTDGQIIISCIFPLLIMWLNFKATQGIKHDEDLVKSYDRIR